MSTGSESTLRTYERIAPFYDLLDAPFEHLRYRPIRPHLWHGLKGRLLDAGVGTGRNFPFYPSGSGVVGVDLSPAMLKRAARRQRDSRVPLELLQMDLVQLEFASESFDAAVASFVFCTMPAEIRIAALRELARIVKPSGCVRMLEYASAQSTFRRGVARIWQPWAEWAFGAKLGNEIERELPEAGLLLTRSRYVSTSIRLIEAVPRVV